MAVQHPVRPLALEQFSDGGWYDCSEFLRPSFKSLLHVSRVDDLFIKMATPKLLGVPGGSGDDESLAKYLNDLAKLKRSDLSRYNRVRLLEDVERPSNFTSTLEHYPAFRASLEAFGIEASGANADAHTVVMFLILCRSNYDRLKKISTVAIPESRFVIIRTVTAGLLPWPSKKVNVAPAIVQQNVSGTMLWDMYSKGAEAIKPAWKPFVRQMSEQLKPMLHSDVAKFIDWNPENFMFDKENGKVYYIDSEPNIWMGMRANEHNLQGVRRFFCE